jgi:hypothetical protein
MVPAGLTILSLVHDDECESLLEQLLIEDMEEAAEKIATPFHTFECSIEFEETLPDGSKAEREVKLEITALSITVGTKAL